MKLTPQQKQLIELLADGQWHCTVSEQFMKDDRARISELRHKGFIFDESGKICDRHNHGSKLKLRRLISFPDNFVHPYEQGLYEAHKQAIHPKAAEFLTRWQKPQEIKQQTLL
jgi:hypothetical protein